MWITRIMAIGLGMALAAAAAAPPPAAGEGDRVPFTIDEIFGQRPVVDATINGHPFRLVVHANAGSYLQINHAEAAKVGARDLRHRGSYGISAPGKVSDLGRDDGVIDALGIGGWRAKAVPVAVFEVPAGGSQGMLGLPFLTANNAVLDFGQRRMTLPGAAPSAAQAEAMAGRGFSAHRMTRDPADGRYLVTVTINGVSLPMVVSTVAGVDIDTVFAQRAGVALGEVSGKFAGPSGATGLVHATAKPLTLTIGDWRSPPMAVSVQDTYAYSKAARPADPSLARGGALGADFMIANQAVIDFGNETLYLKNAGG